jgi:hypothetical protein
MAIDAARLGYTAIDTARLGHTAIESDAARLDHTSTLLDWTAVSWPSMTPWMI